MSRKRRIRRGLAVGAGAVVVVTGAALLAWWPPHAVPVDTPARSVSARGASSPGIVDDAPQLADIDPGRPLVAADTEFRDPFYAFLVGLAEDDSLGRWGRDEVLARVAAGGRESQLPLDRILGVERLAVDDSATTVRAGRRPRRVWRVTLDDRLDYPMPYRVLGHSLGTLDVSSELIFSEWLLGDCRVFAPEDGAVTGVTVENLTAFRLEEGWIVMDVAGLVDRLLGGKLDDCWTQGFAICRREGRLHGLAVSCNRDLEPFCGEIDFATNEIIPDGRPVARGVAVYVRPWLRPGDDVARAWGGGE